MALARDLLWLVPFGLIIFPWWARRRHGSSGVWGYTLIGILVSGLLMVGLLFVTCEAANCGRVDLLIILLVGSWILAAILAIISAVFAIATLQNNAEAAPSDGTWKF